MLRGECGIIPPYPVERLVIVRKGMRSTGQLYKNVSATESAWGLFPVRHPQPLHAWRRLVRDPLGHTSRLDRTRMDAAFSRERAATLKMKQKRRSCYEKQRAG